MKIKDFCKIFLVSVSIAGAMTMFLVSFFWKTSSEVISYDIDLIMRQAELAIDSEAYISHLNQISSHPYVACVKVFKNESKILESGKNCLEKWLVLNGPDIYSKLPPRELSVQVKSQLPARVMSLLGIFSVTICLFAYFLGYLAIRYKTVRLAREIEQHRGFQLFARKVAHDIRAPIGALKVAFSMIDFKGDQSLENLGKGALTRLSDITKNLLDFKMGGVTPNLLVLRDESKQIRKKQEIHFNPKEVIEQVQAEMNLRHSETTKILVTGAMPTLARGDADNFYRILSNIVQNAAEASGMGGMVSIQVCAEPNEGNIKISISDNGPGIPKIILKNKGKKPLTFGKLQGNGLGLHGAYTTMKEWGGDIKIENKTVGNGAIVTLILPKK